ncbi:MAG: hypothetical protein KC731_30305, partial [Myxococcales bacterium]|nr:hypothetical protein [Myxococcales bacterium]
RAVLDHLEALSAEVARLQAELEARADDDEKGRGGGDEPPRHELPRNDPPDARWRATWLAVAAVGVTVTSLVMLVSLRSIATSALARLAAVASEVEAPRPRWAALPVVEPARHLDPDAAQRVFRGSRQRALVVVLDDGRRRVAADLFERALARKAGRPPWVRPVRRGPGEPVEGLELRGLRKGSLWEALGFEAGDVVDSVNGYGLATPDEALTAYAALQGERQLQVRLRRHGRPMTLRYLVE